MKNLQIEGTDNTPCVDFDFQTNRYGLGGRSYNENNYGFYNPLLRDFETHLTTLNNAEIVFDFNLTYFNSSAARFILAFFTLLDAAAERGNTVTVVWHYEEEDPDTLELGEEYAEELEHATFKLNAIST